MNISSKIYGLLLKIYLYIYIWYIYIILVPNFLVPNLLEPNFHTTKFFTEHLLAIEMKTTEICINKPVYLGLSILELSRILMYGF